MATQTLIYLFVAGSFALYIGIAIWARAGSTKDFYVAGVFSRFLDVPINLGVIIGMGTAASTQ